MIYDCFLYNGEADILELRLHELADVVDVFVLVEACETFTGEFKRVQWNPFSKDPRFAEFLPRIWEWPARTSLSARNAWERESYHRNTIGDALREFGAQPDDLILVSDVDEIPRAESVRFAADLIQGGEQRVAFRQDVYFYHPQCLNLLTWYGTRATAYRNLGSPQSMRATEYTNGSEAVIVEGGWHFSYFMDTAAIQRKLAAYSHTEVNQPPYNTAENIEAAMRECRSLVPTDGQRFRRVEHGGENAPDLPAYMLAHPERYGLEVAVMA